MSKLRLKDIDTCAPHHADKNKTKEDLKDLLADLNGLQNLMYAESRHSLLIIIQGMDAAGKDGLIRDVLTSMNPQGVNVTSFKEPTKEELAHDFLWRIHAHTPPRGMIQVFNRSQYEDVLITRVHGLIDNKLAQKRMHAINDLENMLTEHNNTTILKFYLHISHAEQIKRLEERVEKPQKMWKYNESDFNESKLWNTYMRCYEDVFEHCNKIPWNIIPADQNWYKSYLVAAIIQKALKDMHMKFPGLKKEKHHVAQ